MRAHNRPTIQSSAASEFTARVARRPAVTAGFAVGETSWGGEGSNRGQEPVAISMCEDSALCRFVATHLPAELTRRFHHSSDVLGADALDGPLEPPQLADVDKGRTDESTEPKRHAVAFSVDRLVIRRFFDGTSTVAVRLILSSGAERFIESADTAHLDGPFFLVTKQRSNPNERDTLLTLRADDVVAAEVLKNGVRIDYVLDKGQP
jgi:hypothetical protein